MRQFFRGLNRALERIVLGAAGAGQADVPALPMLSGALGELPDAPDSERLQVKMLGLLSAETRAIVGKLHRPLHGANLWNKIGVATQLVPYGERSFPVLVCDMPAYPETRVTDATCRTANAILLVYNPCDGKSFEKMPEWITDCLSNDTVCWLVENNVDPKGKKVISPRQAQALADQHNINFYRLSSKPENDIYKLLHDVVERKIAPEVSTEKLTHGIQARKKRRQYPVNIPGNFAEGLVREAGLPPGVALKTVSYLVGILTQEQAGEIFQSVSQIERAPGDRSCPKFFKKLAETSNAAGASEGKTADPDPYGEGKAEAPLKPHVV